MKIAISGKGGVGKTTIMALLAGHLKTTGHQVLVIDADSSPHMAQTLGIEHPEKVTAIAEMRELLRERSGYTEGSPFYNINPEIDDLPERFMLEKDGLKLMVLGAIQTGAKGCACAENTVLKRLLTKLLLHPEQMVLLDMEAGVEHLGRGTIAGIDHLLVVVIPSQSSLRTALTIQKMAQDVRIPKVSFVGNSIAGPEDVAFIEQGLQAPLLACLPDAPEIRLAERRGTAVTSLAANFAVPLQTIVDAVCGG